MQKKQSSLLILFSVVVLDLIGFGIVIPILPFYAEQYGANATTLGLLLTSYAVMQFAFSPNNPIITFDDISTETGKNIQQGYMQIFTGAMIGIRNPKAHGIVDIDETRAIHFLFLASLMMHKLDEAS